MSFSLYKPWEWEYWNDLFSSITIGFEISRMAFRNWSYLISLDPSNKDIPFAKQWVFYWMGDDESPEYDESISLELFRINR